MPFARVDVAEDVAAVRWVRAELQRGAVFTNRVDTFRPFERWHVVSGRRPPIDVLSNMFGNRLRRVHPLFARSLHRALFHSAAHRCLERSNQRSKTCVRIALPSARHGGRRYTCVALFRALAGAVARRSEECSIVRVDPPSRPLR